MEKQKRGRKPGSVETCEAWAMLNLPSGSVFYSDKAARHLTALASHYGRKIATSHLIAVTSAKINPSAKVIIQITILK